MSTRPARWDSHTRKKAVEGCYQLRITDVITLLRRGVGRTFYVCTRIMVWAEGDQGQIHITFAGKLTRRNLIRTGRRQARWYWCCPVCGKHVLILYAPTVSDEWRCRACWNLCYAAQQNWFASEAHRIQHFQRLMKRWGRSLDASSIEDERADAWYMRGALLSARIAATWQSWSKFLAQLEQLEIPQMS